MIVSRFYEERTRQLAPKWLTFHGFDEETVTETRPEYAAEVK
jgi:hypothetical protein